MCSGLPAGAVRAASVLALVLAVAVTVSACAAPTGFDAVSTPDTGSTGGAVGRFAPYVDVTAPRPRLADLARATGDTTFVLAFVLAGDNSCDPRWDGQTPVGDAGLVSEVSALRAQGGDVVVATGGADGPYLETACTSADALARAYEKALDAVGSHHLDVDIEHSVPVDTMNRALLTVQRDRQVDITYTLPVANQTTGLSPDALNVLHSAAALGVTATVNAMVMNFPYSGSWSDAMIAAAEATAGQIRSVWPDKTPDQVYRALGLTAMIGRNDVGMTTTTADARALLGYARSHSIGYLGFWAIARDNGTCPQEKVAANDCSGVTQSPYEFNGIFRGASS
ncbi:glycosyl hydrolase [Pseudonocardia acidicola]|uniref:Glycosyl hydrolase n=1 Tax=Pseudonocardia acidicola TaxID=2724939 RepID=A0ABX1SJB4_9PSEU|nr:glycosyl hydrolase [Pseudonocardia acidicola]NMI00913.1 glycosyl hydrolase [Pseudonocardia acidicola]